MPELPEVQTILDAIAALILDQPIADVIVGWEGVIDRPPLPVFIIRRDPRRIS